MWLKRFFRRLLFFIAGLLSLFLLVLLFTVVPVDRTSYKQLPFYSEMKARLDSLHSADVKETSGVFTVGYNVENLVPPFPVATAGYGNRRGQNYTAIHDSIYVRSLVIDNGNQKVAIVSADLLIIPPAVTRALGEKLSTIGYSLKNIYLNATHTHNSIGNWGEGAAGLVYGSYEDSVVQFIADKIVKSIRAASANGVRSRFSYGTIAVPDAVRNRIDGVNGKVDSLLRVVEILRDDSSRLAMVIFNAHPTCLFSKDLELSRDYPGEVVDKIENNGYAFAMFLSGAVGSHGCNPPEYGKPCLTWMADEIVTKFNELRPSMIISKDSTLSFVRLPLALGEPQIKIARDWRLRPWVFKRALGEYQPFINALRLGEVVFLGTPCDFSGELTAAIDSAASVYHKHAVVTSFNGQYIGYITNDVYYDNPHYETRLMNWYGPGNGRYLSESLVRLFATVAD
jgi:neutral ceramidase